MSNEISFVDVNKKEMSNNIECLFPGWKHEKESVCVFSPHDDDAIIGASYVMQAAIKNGAEVYVFIFCDGNAGYSIVQQKDEIVEIRKVETIRAYKEIGVKEENIIRLGYTDFSVLQNIGWKLVNGSDGSFKKILTKLRELNITRAVVPNHYREHIDHTAVNTIGAYDVPQAGDPILVDWAKPQTVESVLEYSVWADLSPEDSLVEGRNTQLRANRLILADELVESRVCNGIYRYESQGEIIKGLVASRKERKCKDGRYVEVYLAYDPRPKLDYAPYRDFVENL